MSKKLSGKYVVIADKSISVKGKLVSKGEDFDAKDVHEKTLENLIKKGSVVSEKEADALKKQLAEKTSVSDKLKAQVAELSKEKEELEAQVKELEAKVAELSKK